MRNLLFLVLISNLVFLPSACTDTANINDDLRKAVTDGDIDTVRDLLDKGADVNAEDQDGRTTLETAVDSVHLGPKRIKIIKLLLEKGADSKNKDDALYVADQSCDEEAAELLIKAGARRDESREFYRDMKLYNAAKRGNTGEVKKLLDQGADPNMMRTCGAAHGTSPLMEAAYKGHLDIVNALLEKGAEINAQGGVHFDWTALIHAASGGHNEVVKVLIKAGADVNIVSHDYSETALYEALESDYEKIVTMLLKAGAKITARDFFKALYRGEYEIIKLLIDYGADVNAAHDGTTPLKRAKDYLKGFSDVGSKDNEHNAWMLKKAEEYKKIIELLKKAGAKE